MGSGSMSEPWFASYEPIMVVPTVSSHTRPTETELVVAHSADSVVMEPDLVSVVVVQLAPPEKGSEHASEVSGDIECEGTT